MQRRQLILSALAASLMSRLQPGYAQASTAPQQLRLTIFSRHLQWLTTQAVAETDPYGTGLLIGNKAQEIGFKAVDLTVRSTGHVDPTRVDISTNLPKMISGVRSTGAFCNHITTNIIDTTSALGSASSPVTPEDLLRVAADNGIKLYRWDGFNYATFNNTSFGDQILTQLEGFADRTKLLAELNHKYGMTSIYHTYSGGNRLRSVWDLLYMLHFNDTSPSDAAINFDIGHMVAESALSSWSTNVRYALPNIGGVGLKDYVLQRNTNGTVSAVSTLAGQGMVQLRAFFQLLLQGGYSGPAEAQYEYSVTGLNGTSFSLNTTFWADNAQMTSGNLTPAFLTEELKKDCKTYKDAIAAAGWQPEQLV
jgi:hypothetical protein